jgi:regulator of protease activity HflC (stomatin/prohibitin superfamily)
MERGYGSLDSGVKAVIWGVVGLVLLIIVLILNPIVLIGAGERGVVLNLGAVSNTIMNEGLNFRTPFIQSVHVFDVKMQKDEVETGAASKDLQEVKTTIALNYHLMVDQVNKLYQNIGTDFKRRIIDPAIQEAVKAATAKFTAEEAITKRQEVREEIKKILTARLQREYIVVDEVSITDFDFSNEFNRAIEEKVTAEQKALQAKNTLEQKRYEAEQIVVTATATAQSIKIQSEAANNEKYVALKALDVQSEAVKKWDGKLPVQMIPGSAVPFIHIGQDSERSR